MIDFFFYKNCDFIDNSDQNLLLKVKMFHLKLDFVKLFKIYFYQFSSFSPLIVEKNSFRCDLYIDLLLFSIRELNLSTASTLDRKISQNLK